MFIAALPAGKKACWRIDGRGGAIAFLAPPFEAHHVLHDGFAGFGDFALLAHLVSARFAELLGFSGDLDGDELVGFVTARLAGRHG
jgi:hypothetical protein